MPKLEEFKSKFWISIPDAKIRVLLAPLVHRSVVDDLDVVPEGQGGPELRPLGTGRAAVPAVALAPRLERLQRVVRHLPSVTKLNWEINLITKEEIVS